MSRKRGLAVQDAAKWVREMRRLGVAQFRVGEFEAVITPGDQLAPRIGFGVMEMIDEAAEATTKRRRKR